LLRHGPVTAVSLLCDCSVWQSYFRPPSSFVGCCGCPTYVGRSFWESLAGRGPRPVHPFPQCLFFMRHHAHGHSQFAAPDPRSVSAVCCAASPTGAPMKHLFRTYQPIHKFLCCRILLNYFKINATTTTSEAGARSSTRNRDSCFVRDQKRERERERERCPVPAEVRLEPDSDQDLNGHHDEIKSAPHGAREIPENQRRIPVHQEFRRF